MSDPDVEKVCERSAGIVDMLRLHAFDDCNEQHIPTHACNVAADFVEEAAALLRKLSARLALANAESAHLDMLLKRAIDEMLPSAEAENEQFRGHLATCAGKLMVAEKQVESLQAEIAALKEALAEAVRFGAQYAISSFGSRPFPVLIDNAVSAWKEANRD